MSSMRMFRRALRSAAGRACAYQLRDGYGAATAPLLTRVIRGERVHDEEIREGFSDGGDALVASPLRVPGPKPGKATALLSARGIAMYDVEFQPVAFSTLHLAREMARLAKDPEVSQIIIEFDTPGGAVTGMPEAGDAIFAARRAGKHVVALVSPLAASAGYWLASQCSEIVAVPSADVGSIGVFMMHMNCAGMVEQAGVEPTFIFAGKFKTEGNAFEPLSDAARENYQTEVDTIYRAFLRAVARGRETSVADVEANFGQGRTMLAPAAKKVGMIDRIATPLATLERLGVAVDGEQVRRRNQANDVCVDDTVAGELGSEPDQPEPEDRQQPDGSDPNGRAARARRLALLRA